MGSVSGAVASRGFGSLAALEAQPGRWTREMAGVRVHGATGEAPMVRFARDEAAALRPLPDRRSFDAGGRGDRLGRRGGGARGGGGPRHGRGVPSEAHEPIAEGDVEAAPSGAHAAV